MLDQAVITQVSEITLHQTITVTLLDPTNASGSARRWEHWPVASIRSGADR